MTGRRSVYPARHRDPVQHVDVDTDDFPITEQRILAADVRGALDDRPSPYMAIHPDGTRHVLSRAAWGHIVSRWTDHRGEPWARNAVEAIDRGSWTSPAGWTYERR